MSNAQCVNLAITGYYGTGSSAVLDLLSEYENVKILPYDYAAYEHVPFYTSGGLFDVCSLLSRGNTPFTSDMVVNNFIKSMKRLNKYDFAWFGSYNKLVDDKFENLYIEFINSISEKKNGTSGAHIIRTRFSLVKAIAQIIAKVTLGRQFTRYGVKNVFDSNDSYIALPDEEKLYDCARKFTSGYMDMFECDNTCKCKVFDHLIWPNQIDSFRECFDDNFKVIVVNRDPRDVYLSNKYVWFKPPVGHGVPYFPTEVDKFSEQWKNTIVTKYESDNVLNIFFEDLVYDYQNTVKKIEDFVGLDNDDHILPKCRFNPDASVENTQVFNANRKWNDEIEELSVQLTEYLYEFPYKRNPDKSLMFDNPKAMKNKR